MSALIPHVPQRYWGSKTTAAAVPRAGCYPRNVDSREQAQRLNGSKITQHSELEVHDKPPVVDSREESRATLDEDVLSE